MSYTFDDNMSKIEWENNAFLLLEDTYLKRKDLPSYQRFKLVRALISSTFWFGAKWGEKELKELEKECFQR